MVTVYSNNVLIMEDDVDYQACSQGGSVGSEEPHSQRKVHFLKKKVHCYNRDLGIGPVDLAAARLKFHSQLKIVVIN